jgi:hypothetical protein
MVFLVVIFLLDFPPIPYMDFPFMLHAMPLTSSLTWRLKCKENQKWNDLRHPPEIRRSHLECYLHTQSRKQLAPIEISSCDNVDLFCEITVLSRAKSSS